MEHDIPVRVAPCPLLFGANGGQFNNKGLPIFNDVDESGHSIRSLCDTPFDCGVCPLLKRWVDDRVSKGWAVGWECNECLKQSSYYERNNQDVERELPGFYQAGRVPVPIEHGDFDPDKPPLNGCTSCGYETSFLQLVLRRARRGV